MLCTEYLSSLSCRGFTLRFIKNEGGLEVKRDTKVELFTVVNRL